jgi:hypothetical protein
VAVPHQSRLFQQPKMLGHSRLRDTSPGSQSPDRLFSFAAQSFEESSPGRIGERSEKDTVSVRHFR